MRPLSDEETRVVFEKLKSYLGANLRQLIDRPDETYVFRLQKDRVFYVSEKVVKAAGHISKKNMMSAGVCVGKFTHSGKFRMSITFLDIVARLARFKVWLKPSGEQSFVYGNHVLKAHLRRITEDVTKNGGVVVFSENDVPLGFGSSAMDTAGCHSAKLESIVVYHHADIGEYLREEADLI
eukprot:GEMP01033624.1.p1 GENE.GEMP01033624.1~~GEMP01033624.1.p1  ORF type:complete len:181 (-),score=16.35 GEMP01033624.1:1474-2016(-)